MCAVTHAGDDIRVLESGAQIVSGTPGRVYDMIKRRSLDVHNMKILVLDEADEMLNKGFREQIYDVYRYLPPDIQVILVSATLPHDVLEMTHKFMQDPVRVLVKRDELTLEVSTIRFCCWFCCFVLQCMGLPELSYGIAGLHPLTL